MTNDYQNKRMEVFEKANYQCAMCNMPANQVHHVKPDTKANNRRWPLYINSIENMMAICEPCHLWKPLDRPPSDLECDKLEANLQRIKNGEES